MILLFDPIDSYFEIIIPFKMADQELLLSPVRKNKRGQVREIILHILVPGHVFYVCKIRPWLD